MSDVVVPFRPKHWLPPLEGKPNPCANCPPIGQALAPDRIIAVGFGYAGVQCDGTEVWSEPMGDDEHECWQVSDAEKAAAAKPDADWRIVFHGPLHGETYQRQGAGNWVLVEKNEGFA